MPIRLSAAAVLLFSFAAPAWSQTLPPRVTKEVDLSGPRFGLTMLSQGNVDKLKEHDITVRPMISQFGWQFERRLYTKPTASRAH
jgi:hypothetical protein